MTGYRESVLPIRCADSWLTGIVAAPVAMEKAPETAVLIVVGGPQYRAGSHRQFVLLSRSLAAAGHLALRFDYRGMGDSGGELRSFEDVSEDLGAAIDAVQAAHPGIRRFVLWGLCDGASAALLYLDAMRDARVAGLCLVNPWVRSAASLATTQIKHYYLQRLLQRQFWLKFLGGGLSVGALRDFGRALITAVKSRMASQSPARSGNFRDRMAAAWHDSNVPLLVILSGQDYVAKEFIEHARSSPAWQGLLSKGGVSLCEFAQADHTFSNAEARQLVEQATARWLSEHVATPTSRPRART